MTKCDPLSYFLKSFENLLAEKEFLELLSGMIVTSTVIAHIVTVFEETAV